MKSRLVLAAAFALAFGLGAAGCVLDLSDDHPGGDPGDSLAPCGGFAGQICPSDEYCDYTSPTCGIADDSGVCRQRPEICNDIYSPVRGSDGMVYPNACEAHAHGADDCGAPPP